MKTLFLVVAMLSPFVPQSGGGPVAGVWTAEFAGRTFIRLELKTVSGAIAGGVSLGNFEIDGQGLVRRADEAPKDLTPIFGVARRGSTLTFSRKDVDETDRFELRVLDAAAAELLLVLSEEDRKELAAAGIPLPKPIRLTRR